MGIDNFHAAVAAKAKVPLAVLKAWMEKNRLPLKVFVDLSVIIVKVVAWKSTVLNAVTHGNPDQFGPLALRHVQPLLEAGFDVVLVADGMTPLAKTAHHSRRADREKRALAARTKLSAARSPEEKKAAWKLYCSTVGASTGIVDAVEATVRARNNANLQLVRAPFEADAQLAQLVQKGGGLVYSPDSDLFTYGLKQLITALSGTNLKIESLVPLTLSKEVKLKPPKAAKAYCKLPARGRALFGALVGNDYLEGGAPGFGPAKLFDLLEEEKGDMDAVLENVLHSLQLKTRRKNPLTATEVATLKRKVEIAVAAALFQPARETGAPGAPLVHVHALGGPLPAECDDIALEGDVVAAPEVWCLCRNVAGDEQMIECDDCEMWFHVRCVGLTPARALRLAAQKEKWQCPRCAPSHVDTLICTVKPQEQAELEDAMLLSVLTTSDVPQAGLVLELLDITAKDDLEAFVRARGRNVSDLSEVELKTFVKRLLSDERSGLPQWIVDPTGGVLEREKARSLVNNGKLTWLQGAWAFDLPVPECTNSMKNDDFWAWLPVDMLAKVLLPLSRALLLRIPDADSTVPADVRKLDTATGNLHSRYVLDVARAMRPLRDHAGGQRLLTRGLQTATSRRCAGVAAIEFGFLTVGLPTHVTGPALYLKMVLPASQRKEERTAELWLNTAGFVGARCSCPMANVACQHAMAMLLLLEQCALWGECGLAHAFVDILCARGEPSAGDLDEIATILEQTNGAGSGEYAAATTQRAKSRPALSPTDKAHQPLRELKLHSVRAQAKAERASPTKRARTEPPEDAEEEKSDSHSDTVFPPNFDPTIVHWDGLARVLFDAGLCPNTLAGQIAFLKASAYLRNQIQLETHSPKRKQAADVESGSEWARRMPSLLSHEPPKPQPTSESAPMAPVKRSRTVVKWRSCDFHGCACTDSTCKGAWKTAPGASRAQNVKLQQRKEAARRHVYMVLGLTPPTFGEHDPDPPRYCACHLRNGVLVGYGPKHHEATFRTAAALSPGRASVGVARDYAQRTLRDSLAALFDAHSFVDELVTDYEGRVCKLKKKLAEARAQAATRPPLRWSAVAGDSAHVRALTGWPNASAFESFAFFLCNSDWSILERVRIQRGDWDPREPRPDRRNLGWQDELLAYFMAEFSTRSLQDLAREFQVSNPTIKRIVWTWARVCRTRFDAFSQILDDETYEKLLPARWAVRRSDVGERVLMEDSTNISFGFQPTDSVTSKAMFNAYYGEPCAKGTVVLCASGLQFSLPLYTGNIADTELLTREGYFPRVAAATKLHVKHVDDRAYRCDAEASAHNQSIERPPSKMTEQLSPLAALRTAETAHNRAESERAVQRTKFFGCNRRRIVPGSDLRLVDLLWCNSGDRANWILRPLYLEDVETFRTKWLS